MRGAGRKRSAVPEAVHAEIACGIERLPKSKKRSKLLDLYSAIHEELGSMSWTHDVTERFASVKSSLEQTRIEDFDAAIAAHALAVGASYRGRRDLGFDLGDAGSVRTPLGFLTYSRDTASERNLGYSRAPLGFFRRGIVIGSGILLIPTSRWSKANPIVQLEDDHFDMKAGGKTFGARVRSRLRG